MTGFSHALTLGTGDTARALDFYKDVFGATTRSDGRGFQVVQFPRCQASLYLCEWGALAEDSRVPANTNGFRGVMLSYIVEKVEHVDQLAARARRAHARVLREPHGAFWGYSAHLQDPDGHIWKVAASPAPKIRRRSDADGAVTQEVIAPKEIAVTLAADDFKSSRQFYSDALDFKIDKSFPGFASFVLGTGEPSLSLYKRKALAKDAGVEPAGAGFSGVRLSITVPGPDTVDRILAKATAGGGTITRVAEGADSAEYTGNFLDPDRYVWKVASAG
jgi:uncharacterized protein